MDKYVEGLIKRAVRSLRNDIPIPIDLVAALQEVGIPVSIIHDYVYMNKA